MGDGTRLLDRWNDGDPEALKALVAQVYAELRRIAGSLLRDERANHTLQPTALVHEAYMRLIGVREMRIENRRHFYGAAAMAMRRILVDHARTRSAEKRGGPDIQRVPLDDAIAMPIDVRLDFERLDEALQALADFAPEGQGGGAPLFRRALHRGDGGGARRVSRHRQAPLGVRAHAWLFRALDGHVPQES